MDESSDSADAIQKEFEFICIFFAVAGDAVGSVVNIIKYCLNITWIETTIFQFDRSQLFECICGDCQIINQVKQGSDIKYLLVNLH